MSSHVRAKQTSKGQGSENLWKEKFEVATTYVKFQQLSHCKLYLTLISIRNMIAH